MQTASCSERIPQLTNTQHPLWLDKFRELRGVYNYDNGNDVFEDFKKFVEVSGNRFNIGSRTITFAIVQISKPKGVLTVMLRIVVQHERIVIRLCATQESFFSSIVCFNHFSKLFGI